MAIHEDGNTGFVRDHYRVDETARMTFDDQAVSMTDRSVTDLNVWLTYRLVPPSLTEHIVVQP